MDADELAFLAEYRRRRVLVLSVPQHFSHLPLRGHRGFGDVMESLANKGYVVLEPAAPLQVSYRLTQAGIDHCGGLTVFVP